MCWKQTASLLCTRVVGVQALACHAGENSRLNLLQAGTRPEEIAAETARKERVERELAYLKSQKEKLTLRATATGIFSAPPLKERVRLAVPQDTLFCTIEMPKTSRVEISVSEDEAAHLKAGQAVTLKARAIPFETFEARVEGISATALRTATAGHNVAACEHGTGISSCDHF